MPVREEPESGFNRFPERLSEPQRHDGPRNVAAGYSTRRQISVVLSVTARPATGTSMSLAQ